MRPLLPHIGDLEPHQVHDATPAPFIASRVAVGASATTINRRLEVVRVILNRAARSYRDADGTPWLTGIAARGRNRTHDPLVRRHVFTHTVPACHRHASDEHP